MGLIAEWNRTDLTQLVDASTPQFTNGAGAPTLTVEAVAEAVQLAKEALLTATTTA